MSPEKRINIITDSAANLTQETIDKYNIGIVRLNVNINDGKITQTYIDTQDLDEKSFVEKQNDRSLKISTSSPSGKEFIGLYDKFPGETLSIHIASELSATFNSAKIIAESVERKNITFYDSETLSVLTGRLVVEAAKMEAEGKSIDEVILQLDDIKKRSVLFATFNTLDYLLAGGRISHLKYGLGKFLNIKPILQIGNNKIIELKKENNIHKSINTIMKIALNLEPEEIYIMHGGDKEYKVKVDEIASEFAEKTNNEIPISKRYIGTGLAAHAGPETIGIGVVSKNPIPEKIIFKYS